MNTGDNLVLTWTSSGNSDWKFHYFWSFQSDLQEPSSGSNSVRSLSVRACSCLILDVCFCVSLKEILGILNVWCHWKNVHCRPLLGHWGCAPNSWDLQFPPRGVLDLASVWVRVLTETVGNRSGLKCDLNCMWRIANSLFSQFSFWKRSLLVFSQPYRICNLWLPS